jgi:cephalosporin hydroxylase
MIETKALLAMAKDQHLHRTARGLFNRLCRYKYSYHFTWLGRPIIQFPQDVVAMQELVWRCRPDLIIETGVAHGGSLVFFASMLALLDLCEPREKRVQTRREVLGIDIRIRPPNRKAILRHPLSRYIRLIEGSSIDPAIVRQISPIARKRRRVMVCLDSNHTHEHVLRELQAYAPLVSIGSYLVVFDTVVEDMPKALFPNRPWGPGNNPKTAIRQFLRTQKQMKFVRERLLEDKLVFSVAPEGYLRRVR